MPFLSIGSFGALEVLSEGATEEEPEVGGEDVRSFAGNLRSVVAWEKRSWSFESGWLTQAQYNSLKTVIANGAQVACSGDAIDNANVTCRVKIRAGQYIDIAGATFNRTARITLIEV